jgi:hypothetical protein
MDVLLAFNNGAKAAMAVVGSGQNVSSIAQERLATH